MSDPFRRLFLDLVERCLQEEPSRHALLPLLQLATPSLVCLGSSNEISKTFKALLVKVHPDKHHHDTARATKLCQDAQGFYENCLAFNVGGPEVNKKHKKSSASSPRNSLYPLEFSIVNRWPHTARSFNCPILQEHWTSEKISKSVAYQCINVRGAIAHGKKPELAYDDDTDGQSLNCAKDVFNSFGGHIKLVGVDAIKSELTSCGPVVSASFEPSEAFLNSNNIGKQREVLIIGWTQLASGEVWIVQPLATFAHITPSTIYVAVGQFEVDTLCLAPKCNFDDVPWQAGPYYDGNMNGIEDEWRIWGNIQFYVRSLCQLDDLFKETGATLFGIPTKPVVTVRNKSKKAHSRRATLDGITWNSVKGTFTVDFTFTE